MFFPLPIYKLKHKFQDFIINIECPVLIRRCSVSYGRFDRGFLRQESCDLHLGHCYITVSSANHHTKDYDMLGALKLTNEIRILYTTTKVKCKTIIAIKISPVSKSLFTKQLLKTLFFLIFPY